MATTTNYGWTTPDDTALVKDGASAIRTLGSSVDTTTKNLNPSTTLGDIEYRSSTSNVNTRLGIGSTGNVLTVAGGVPTWAAPAGGGKVLQVVSATTTTLTTINTGTFTDTGLTASITPTSNTSKILVLVSQRYQVAGGDDAGINWRLLRGATAIGTTSGTGSQYQYIRAQGVPSFNSYLYANHSFLDSPATTSSTTYKTQGSGSTSIAFQTDTGLSSIILMEIGA
jgi:hypothetical protein